MAGKRRWDSCGRAAMAAAGCLALLLTACSAPLPRPEGQSPAPAGSTGPSAAPLAFLPATIAGTESGRGAPAASPAPGSGTEATAPPVRAYFVLMDDGGRHGVRFGCNDSLVGAALAGGAGDDRLKAAVNAILGGGQQPENLYNALGSSRLRFLSGSFDGTTVTVYLAGTLNPGGTCDLPRIEAQLTQTALEAVGAVKAAIYINGETLADYLKLK
ncbi:GerMN domain-containing protein [Arthrobacter sp. FW306-05-C]|uniref:GerMN domain-containing protein n=1 Tax=Arthrobacter sp. FW306-05-C TaxID=2879620 RepID=UPI001F2F76BE|nr:GerMN domain-containing protein [Arthrobacter sp. FW306-05-C]UKA66731.1 GerMN domain-containing protein [Arthrobacter sp. FW306-05-C]